MLQSVGQDLDGSLVAWDNIMVWVRNKESIDKPQNACGREMIIAPYSDIA
mgnify:CR=1 FL=1